MPRTFLALLFAVALTFAGATRGVLYICTISGTASVSCCCEGGESSHADAQGCCEVEQVEAEPAPTPSFATLAPPAVPLGPVVAPVTWPPAPRLRASRAVVALGPRGPPRPPPAPIYLRIRTLLI